MDIILRRKQPGAVKIDVKRSDYYSLRQNIGVHCEKESQLAPGSD